MGRSALLFAVLLLGALGLAALGLMAFLPPGAAAPPSPQPSPIAINSPATSPTPAPASPTAAPTTSAPVATPSSTATPRAEIGTPFELPGALGSVRVNAPVQRQRVGGQSAPTGESWVVIEVRYEATDALDYDADVWRLEDDEGSRYTPQSTDPGPALGSGSLEAGQSAEGAVTFLVSEDRTITSVVLTGTESDVASFSVP